MPVKTYRLNYIKKVFKLLKTHKNVFHSKTLLTNFLLILRLYLLCYIIKYI